MTNAYSAICSPLFLGALEDGLGLRGGWTGVGSGPRRWSGFDQRHGRSPLTFELRHRNLRRRSQPGRRARGGRPGICWWPKRSAVSHGADSSVRRSSVGWARPAMGDGVIGSPQAFGALQSRFESESPSTTTRSRLFVPRKLGEQASG